MMTLSPRGHIMLMGLEGVVTSRYRDSKNIWTIGVGHTKAAGGLNPETFTGEITLMQALDLFRQDVAQYAIEVARALKVDVTQEQFDALVCWHFNTGAVRRATLTRLLNAGHVEAAANQFAAWTKTPGLADRREKERDLFLNGKYPPPIVTMYPADTKGNVLWSKGKRINATAILKEQGA